MLLAEMTKHEGGRYHDGERFLPWYTGPCLEWLMTLDLNGKVVYEYGIGDSSIWFEKIGATVFGIDTSEDWYNYVVGKSIKNGFSNTKSRDLYVLGNIYSHIICDIVVIDGDYRDECTYYALKQLKKGGYLIIDNYKQPSVLMEWPLTDKLIEGMEQTLYKELGHYDGWQTLVVKKA